MLSKEEKKRTIAEHMRQIMLTLDLDLSNPSLAKTPARIAEMYIEEIFSGLDPANFPHITLQEEEIPQELVLVRNLSFVTFCEHHFVPVVGKAHVAYYPQKKILGLSKIPRIIHYFAARPQLQERLTAQIADSLSSLLDTADVAVILRACHFCMIARGVKHASAEMETHVLKGRFENDPSIRSEFFALLAGA
jgi:GTP cyclohydrolase I